MTERHLYSEFAEKGRGSNTDYLGSPQIKLSSVKKSWHTSICCFIPPSFGQNIIFLGVMLFFDSMENILIIKLT